MRLLLTLVCIAAPFLGSLAFFSNDRRSLLSERIASAGFLALFLQIACLRALGLAGILRPIPIALTTLGLGLALLGVAHRRSGRGVGWMGASLAREARSVLASRGTTLARVSIVFLALTMGLLALQAWLYRSTAWDAVWYHVVMTHEFVLRGASTWRDVPEAYAVGYPNGVELLTAIPCSLLGTTELDDTGQLPFGIIGAAMVVAWARRAGASIGAATSAAAAWAAIPCVFLSMTSNLNDVAYAVSLAGVIYYLWVASPSTSRSWMVLVCASLALATKGTGLFHIALLSVFLVMDQVRGIARSPHLLLDAVLRIAALLWVGFYKAIENVVFTGNPTWPMALRVPFSSIVLDGPIDPHEFRWNGMRGLDSYFFSGDGDLQRMLDTWYDFAPGYEPNMTSGGFGPVHAILGVPALCLGLWALMRARQKTTRVGLAAAYLLFFIALFAPSPWFPRYVLGASIASMAMIAIVASRLGPVPSTVVGLAALVIAGEALSRAAPAGIHSWERHGLFAVLSLDRDERAALPVGGMWPKELTMRRDQTFGPDDALGVDTETWLFGQFYPRGYQSRLLWFPATGTLDEYLRSARDQRIRWVTVGINRPLASRLRAAGARRLYTSGDSIVFELPESTP